MDYFLYDYYGADWIELLEIYPLSDDFIRERRGGHRIRSDYDGDDEEIGKFFEGNRLIENFLIN